jgi:hypothetical protein
VRLSKITRFAAAALAFAVIGVAPARADLIHAVYLYPDLTTVFEDDGTQLTPFSFSMDGGALTLSNSNNAITLTANAFNIFGSAAFNGPELIDLSSSDLISVLLASSTIAGFSQSRISSDAKPIWLNLQGLTVSAGQNAVIDVTSSSSPVPEPSTLALFGAGLAALGAMRRRRKKA